MGTLDQVFQRKRDSDENPQAKPESADPEVQRAAEEEDVRLAEGSKAAKEEAAADTYEEALVREKMQEIEQSRRVAKAEASTSADEAATA